MKFICVGIVFALVFYRCVHQLRRDRQLRRTARDLGCGIVPAGWIAVVETPDPEYNQDGSWWPVIFKVHNQGELYPKCESPTDGRVVMIDGGIEITILGRWHMRDGMPRWCYITNRGGIAHVHSSEGGWGALYALLGDVARELCGSRGLPSRA